MKEIAFDHVPKSKKDFFDNCLPNKAWRMNNLYRIKDKQGNKIKFRMKPEQWTVFNSKHPLKLILKARQLGMTTYIQIDMLDDCIFNGNTSGAVIAHIKADAEAFFKDKIKYAYDNIPPFLVDMFEEIRLDGNAAASLFFKNKSRIMVTTSGRSGTNQNLHISEYGKLCAQRPDKAEEVKSGALNTIDVGMKITIESTAEGRAGHFYELCMDAYRNKQEGTDLTPLDFEFFFFPWFADPTYTLEGTFDIPAKYVEYFTKLDSLGIKLIDGQKRWYVKKAIQQGDTMKREFPSFVEEAFEAAMDGSYFGTQMAQARSKGQICRIPIEVGIPINTFWDLGRDTTAIWFFQKVGFDYRMVDYFENCGEDMAYYVNVLRQRTDGGKPYLYGEAYLPHDGNRKSLGSNNSAQSVLAQNGFNVSIVRKTPRKDLSIERARQMIPKVWFDKAKTATGVTHLDNYRKSWDDKLGDWKKEPVHDKASHGADAFMTFCDGYYEDEYEEEDVNYGIRNATTGY
jgi:hypothetical protein